jgi:hypothetical protein
LRAPLISVILRVILAKGSGKKDRTLDKRPLSSAELQKLRRREAELLERIERLKQRMNETKELDTIAFKTKLYREAQAELRRIQDKLAGREPED